MAAFDVKKHCLVPRHVKLGEREKALLLERYNISLSQLPLVSKKDPVVQGLNVKSGDIVKVVRKSPTAGEAIFYRVVVNA